MRACARARPNTCCSSRSRSPADRSRGRSINCCPPPRKTAHRHEYMPSWSMNDWQYVERQVVVDPKGRQWSVALMDVLGQVGDPDRPSETLALQYSCQLDPMAAGHDGPVGVPPPDVAFVGRRVRR